MLSHQRLHRHLRGRAVAVVTEVMEEQRDDGKDDPLGVDSLRSWLASVEEGARSDPGASPDAALQGAWYDPLLEPGRSGQVSAVADTGHSTPSLAFRAAHEGLAFGDRKPHLAPGPQLPHGALQVHSIEIPEPKASRALALPKLRTKKGELNPVGVVPALFTRGDPLRIAIGGAQGGAGKTTIALDLASTAARMGAQGGAAVALWEATGHGSLAQLLRLPDPVISSEERSVTVYRAPAAWGRFTLVPSPLMPSGDLTLAESETLDHHLTSRHHVVIAELPSRVLAFDAPVAKRAQHLARGAHAVLIPVVPGPGAVDSVKSYLAELAALGVPSGAIWLLVRESAEAEPRRAAYGKAWSSLAGQWTEVPRHVSEVSAALNKGLPPSITDDAMQTAMAGLFSQILDGYRERAKRAEPAASLDPAGIRGEQPPSISALRLRPLEDING